jgi:hypothetical protein
MATTTNYGWTTPDDTDLVKDGAAAIRTLGSSVDTTTKALNPSTTLGDIEYRSATANTNTRLGIGTTGQVLSVVGGVPAWATSDDANAIQNAIVDAKGDLISATAADTPARLAVGADGTVLTADSAESTGLKWATPAGGASFVGASLYNTTNQTIANSTNTILTFNQEYFDTNTFHSTTVNTSRLTIPTGKDGYYQIIGSVPFAVNATGTRYCQVLKNGSILKYFNVPIASGNEYTNSFNIIENAVAGDYFEFQVFQSSGGNLTIYTRSSDQLNVFQISYLGA